MLRLTAGAVADAALPVPDFSDVADAGGCAKEAARPAAAEAADASAYTSGASTSGVARAQDQTRLLVALWL